MEPIESELRPTGKTITDKRNGVTIKTPECVLYVTLRPNNEELEVIKTLKPEQLVSNFDGSQGITVTLEGKLVRVYVPVDPFEEMNPFSKSLIGGSAKSRARHLEVMLERYMRSKKQ